MAARRYLIGVATAAAALFLLPGPTPAAECDNVDAGKCRLTLPSGAELAYVETGSTDGPAVILLHGLTDSARSWAATMQAMRVEWPDLRLLALDQRGHGASSMPDPAACRAAPETCFGMADFAADLLAFVDAKRIRSATLVGHSMGSFVAQEVALTAPDRVDRLVLIATAARGQGNAVIRDYVLDEPVEGSWRKALEGTGKAFPEEVYGLTPRAADPDVESWLAASWDVDPV
ncbi:MAG TPA: alpha/beta fold hydrolase, partial [Geminicoccaceae bacterium]|nr:alpha/beta fold hydrolase [Geminicoccaceae bacterium]